MNWLKRIFGRFHSTSSPTGEADRSRPTEPSISAAGEVDRRAVFKQYELALTQAMMEATTRPGITQGQSVEAWAFERAANDVRRSNGLTANQMLAIVEEGYAKWNTMR